jgi:type IV secretion system protein VirB6|nr:type IV secretion system protein [uncultured Rhodopila sp.]
MNDWMIFTNLYQSFNAPFLAAVNTQSTQLATAVAGPAMLAATVYLAVTASLDLMSGGSGNPVLDIVRRCARLALILAALGAGTYVGVVNNLLLTTLPAGLAAAVAGGIAVGGAAFDHLAGQAWASVVQVWNNFSWDSPKTYVPIIFASLYLIDAIIAISLCFALWVITQVGLGMTVAIGPLALACLINPQTARFFNGWLSTVVSFIIAQVMFVTIFSVLIATVNNTLAQILTGNAATGVNGNDIGGQIHQLVNAGLMFTVAAIVALSAIPIARAIGGGAAAELAPVTRWATGKIAAGHVAAGNAAVSGAQTAGAALSSSSVAGMRSINNIAGRAL